MPSKTVKRKHSHKTNRYSCRAKGGSGTKIKTIVSKAAPVVRTVLSNTKDVSKTILDEMMTDQLKKSYGYYNRKQFKNPHFKLVQSKDDSNLSKYPNISVKHNTHRKRYHLPKEDNFFTPPPSRKYSTNTYAKKKSPENTGPVITHMANLNEVRQTLFK